MTDRTAPARLLERLTATPEVRRLLCLLSARGLIACPCPSASPSGKPKARLLRFVPGHARRGHGREKAPTAIVCCTAGRGAVGGDIGRALVRHGSRYQILAVIDGDGTDRHASASRGGAPGRIPICPDLVDALENAVGIPDYLIFATVSATGMLSNEDRDVAVDAMALGMRIVNGLHQVSGDGLETTESLGPGSHSGGR